jgi:pyridoxine 5-phosphate synthase
MSIAPAIVNVAARLRPAQATLVPEKRMERTTEGGLDLFRKKNLLRRGIGKLKDKNILVSLFIDPDLRQIEEAAQLGADAVEFHTGDYANSLSAARRDSEWRRLKRAVGAARALRITAHAGHGLDYENVKRIVKIEGLDELNIGYSIVTRAVWVGLGRAVREMRGLLR